MLDGHCAPLQLAFGGKLLLALADTAPLAICRAALKACI
jgi:hypothetical protein